MRGYSEASGIWAGFALLNPTCGPFAYTETRYLNVGAQFIAPETLGRNNQRKIGQSL